MFKNLRAEMARLDKTNKDIAIVIKSSDKTVSNKMLGKCEWTRKEMFFIKNSLFPKCTLEYLFFIE